ncbi:MAG: class I SAM-dependent methyltransferase family protein [Nitrososphaerota archaeon]|nr:class I SAM-dependent methyltransferase family protein [Nitrososphaerota archaeon]
MPRLIRAALERAGIEEPDRASSGVDVVGDVAIVRLARFSAAEKRGIARALLAELRNVRVVMEQEGGIEGEFRLRKLRHLAGERRTLTVHRENGCAFKVDVAKCYFSPRLSTERLLIADQVGPRERVLNMFAGVGPFTIPIARRAGAKVTSCELNSYAAELHRENDRLNKVEGLVTVIEGDAAGLPGLTRSKFDRIIMPHPSESDKFLPAALGMAKGKGTIHYYRHVLGEDESEAARSLRQELSALVPRRTKYRIRKIREVGPRWLEMAADIRVPD